MLVTEDLKNNVGVDLKSFHSLVSKWKSLSHVWLFVTPWTIQFMEFSRLEYWKRIAVPFSRGSSQPRDWTQVSRWILYQLSHLEWVAYPFLSGSSQPRNQTGVSYIAGRFFIDWATREAPPLIILGKKRLRIRCLDSNRFGSANSPLVKWP